MDSERLIDLIYAALLGERSWDDFLEALSATLPGGVATLFYFDSSRTRGSWDLCYGLDSSAARDAPYFANINPWMPKAAVRQVGVGVVSDQMLPAPLLRQTEFYNDFLRRRTGTQAAVGVTIIREEGKSFLLSVLTSRDDPEENSKAAELLTALAPHLRRAFHHFRAGPNNKALAEIAGSLFDSKDVGLILVGEGGRIKSASAPAEVMLEQGHGARLTPLGRLQIACPESTRALQRMLERGSDEAHKTWSGIAGQTKVTLARVVKDRFSDYFEGPTVIVLLERLSGDRPVGLKDLAKSYRLTRAEARALAGLVEGKNATAIADEARLSRETVRSQIKSLYAKLDVASQIDVIRRFGSIIPDKRDAP